MPALIVTTWNGSVNSLWDTAGNWSNGVPTANGIAIIDGAVSITGGAVTSGGGAGDLNAIFIAYSYTGSLGSAGTPLQIDPKQVSYDATSGSSASYLDLTGVINTTPDVYIDGATSNGGLHLSGDIALLVVAPSFVGTLTLGNSATFTADIKHLQMMASGGTIDAGNASNVVWQDNSDVRITGGQLIIAENFGSNSTCTISGGTLLVNAWNKGATNGDTLIILGGTVNWLGGVPTFAATSTTGIDDIIILGGTFTLGTNVNGYVSFDTVMQYGGNIDFEASFANVAIDTKYSRFGGTFLPPKQSSIVTTRL